MSLSTEFNQQDVSMKEAPQAAAAAAALPTHYPTSLQSLLAPEKV
jgi:hypothetical protein